MKRFFFVLILTLLWLPVGKAQELIRRHIEQRTFPSIFQAWNPADNLPAEDKDNTLARHDLVFHSPSFFGLQWQQQHEGLATEFTPQSLVSARAKRQTLLQLNPNLLMFAEIRYRDAHRSYLPENHRWWKRDQNGKLEMGWEEGSYIKLDFAGPEFQDHVAQQAKAAVASGVLDGVMLDWWEDDAARLQLVQKIRKAIGEKALILVNANDRQTPQTAPYINGYFMECYRSQTAEDWQRIGDTLRWAETHLKNPRINCVESWFHQSRQDLNLMRAITTLTLTQSDGYALFSDPNPLPTPDHLHDWYNFWNQGLGRATGAGAPQQDGSWRREFENGTVVYNPMGNKPVEVAFAANRQSRATEKIARAHSIAGNDGDIFLKN